MIKTHGYSYFAFLGKKMVFEQTSFISQNYVYFTERRVIGTESNL